MTSTAPDSRHHSALPAAYARASRSVEVAHQLRAGDVAGAMDRLLVLIDPLGDFLSHVQRCRVALWGTNPRLAAVCLQYEERLFDVLDRIQEGLDRRDLVGLTLTLEHAVARALREYSTLDAPMGAVLAPRAPWAA